MLRIAGHGDAPREVRPAHRNVGEPLAEAAEHLVAPRGGANEVRVILEELLQFLLEAAEPEVVVLLPGPNQGPAVDRALVVQFACLGFGVVLLLPLVVPALELAQLPGALLPQPGEERPALSHGAEAGGTGAAV